MAILSPRIRAILGTAAYSSFAIIVYVILGIVITVPLVIFLSDLNAFFLTELGSQNILRVHGLAMLGCELFISIITTLLYYIFKEINGPTKVNSLLFLVVFLIDLIAFSFLVRLSEILLLDGTLSYANKIKPDIIGDRIGYAMIMIICFKLVLVFVKITIGYFSEMIFEIKKTNDRFDIYEADGTAKKVDS